MEVLIMKYLILGAGPAGLTVANKLKQRGITDFLVLEVPGKDSKEPSKNKKDEKVSEKKADLEKKEAAPEKKVEKKNKKESTKIK